MRWKWRINQRRQCHNVRRLSISRRSFACGSRFLSSRNYFPIHHHTHARLVSQFFFRSCCLSSVRESKDVAKARHSSIIQWHWKRCFTSQVVGFLHLSSKKSKVEVKFLQQLAVYKWSVLLRALINGLGEHILKVCGIAIKLKQLASWFLCYLVFGEKKPINWGRSYGIKCLKWESFLDWFSPKRDFSRLVLSKREFTWLILSQREFAWLNIFQKILSGKKIL